MIELINKYPDKIEFEVDYIVYTYDNFKFYLKKIDGQRRVWNGKKRQNKITFNFLQMQVRK